MAQKRRQLAMQEARKRERPARKPTGIELFWGKVLSWRFDDLENEIPLAPIPTFFDSKKHYFSSFKAPILAEARASLINCGMKSLSWGGHKRIKLQVSNPVEPLSWGGYIMHFTVVTPMSKEEMEYMKPGQVFALQCRDQSQSSQVVLAAWANGLSRQGSNSNPRKHVLLLLNSYIPSHETRFEITPLSSLLALQRMYDACIRQSTPPFFNDMLMAKKSTHLRFDSDSDEEILPEEVEAREGMEDTNGISQGPYSQSQSMSNESLIDVAISLESRLNPSQLSALRQFTEEEQPKVTLVQGPPGTGKTSFLVATLVRMMATSSFRKRSRNRVLVCAPSNKATCLLLERLNETLSTNLTSDPMTNIVLIGVQDKIQSVATHDSSICEELLCWDELISLSNRVARLSQLESYTSDDEYQNLIYFIQKRYGLQFYRKYLKEHFESALLDLPSVRNYKPIFNALKTILTRLSRDQGLASAAAKAALDNAEVVFSTIGSAGQSILRQSSTCYLNSGGSDWADWEEEDECDAWSGFSSVLIDEAGQAIEAETLIPISLGCRRLLLVGDPKQLPATLSSTNAVRAQFDRSLLERLMGSMITPSGADGSCVAYDGLPTMLLDTQYRMAEDIVQFPNRYFYGGALHTHPSNGSCTSWFVNNTDVKSVKEKLAFREKNFGGALLWVHTGDRVQANGTFLGYEKRSGSKSIFNEKEALVIVDMVKWFVEGQGVLSASEIVIIAM